MKRQMINSEQLPFPSGIAAAETLRSLYAQGKESVLKARALRTFTGRQKRLAAILAEWTGQHPAEVCA